MYQEKQHQQQMQQSSMSGKAYEAEAEHGEGSGHESCPSESDFTAHACHLSAGAGQLQHITKRQSLYQEQNMDLV